MMQQFSVLVNGGNSASDCDASIVSDNSVNGDRVMLNDGVEDVVVYSYNIESLSDVPEDVFSTDDFWMSQTSKKITVLSLLTVTMILP